MNTSRILRLALSGALSAIATAGAIAAESPTCADTRDDSWIEPEAVQERVETLGYTIEDVAVSDGNCYELNGTNVLGDTVTTYLDPRTGDIVHEDIAR